MLFADAEPLALVGGQDEHDKQTRVENGSLPAALIGFASKTVQPLGRPQLRRRRALQWHVEPRAGLRKAPLFVHDLEEGKIEAVILPPPIEAQPAAGGDRLDVGPAQRL